MKKGRCDNRKLQLFGEFSFGGLKWCDQSGLFGLVKVLQEDKASNAGNGYGE